MGQIKSIIDISGVPRSGTSWLSQIMDSSEDIRMKFQPLFSDSFKDFIGSNSSSNEIRKYYNLVYNKNDDYLDRIYQKKDGLYPVFRKKRSQPSIICTKNVTHHYLIPILLNKITEYSIIGIVRNPCGVLASFKNYPNDFNPDWEFIDEWEFSPKRGGFKPENYFGFHKWKEYVKMMLILKASFPKRVFIIKYEDLFANPINVVTSLFAFFNIEFRDQTIDFLNKSTTIHVEGNLSVFKGEKNISSWKNELSDSVQKDIYSRLINTEFEQFL